MRVCNNCETIFEDYLEAEINYCPIRECGGEVIDIDDNMFEIYLILNEKGYWTENTCSGHSYSQLPRTYIQFREDIPFSKLPKDYILNEHREITKETKALISRSYNRELSRKDLQITIWESLRDLLIWAEELEYCDE